MAEKSFEELYKEFNEKFPIAELRNMSLETYTNYKDENGFAHWMIDKFSTSHEGNYKGCDGINFGIYKYETERELSAKSDNYNDKYAWKTKKYNIDSNASAEEAFKKILEHICEVAKNAQTFALKNDVSSLKKIDENPLPNQLKWKIAYLYSDCKLIGCYSQKELLKLLRKLATNEQFKNDIPISDLQLELIKIKDERPAEFEKAFDSLWSKDKDNNKKEDKTMTNTEKSTLVQKCAELLKNTKNLILHGAPGTGKTFLAKQIAETMGAEWEMVQFHPSYDYTDFVEGIRPTNSEDNTVNSFKKQDGIFKKFCEKALEKTNIYNFTSAWNKLVETLKDKEIINIPFLSKPGTFEIELNNDGSGLRSPRETWTSFLNCEHLYNVYKGLPGMPKAGQDNYMKAILNYMKDNMGLLEYKKEQPFIFIIDEINRGELSKIFGELFFSIDPGYRGKEGKIRTQYANMQNEQNKFDEVLKITDSDNFGHFFVPENVYIIGTMNDIDRSVESMDLAMRRRFTFKEIKATDTQKDILVQLDESIKKTAEECMNQLNNAIWDDGKKEGILSSDYQIGAAYFKKLKDLGNNFTDLWEYNLAPLLKEYLRGQDPDDEKFNKLKDAYDHAASETKTNTSGN